jgi:uncharacterized protein DUF1579
MVPRTNKGLWLVLILLLFVLETGSGRSQQLRMTPAPQNRPPCYHNDFAEFAFLQGDWDVKLNSRLGDGRWEETVAASQIKPDLAGCLLTERLVGSREGRPFHVLSLFAFDNNSKRLQCVLSDSDHGLLALFQGRKLASEIVLDMELTRDDGSKVTIRRAYSEITKDSFTLESKHSRDNRTTWLTVMKARYSRKR